MSILIEMILKYYNYLRQKNDRQYLQVEKAVEEKQEWADKHLGMLSATPLHSDLPVTTSQVMSEKSSFDALVIPIMNKPKPKPKVSFTQ